MVNGSNGMVAVGSVRDVMSAETSLAEAFLGVKLIILCDRSSSMTTTDAGVTGQEPRYQVEDRVVNDLQVSYPGKILLVSFGSAVHPCLDGVLPAPADMTAMLPALKLVSRFLAFDIHCILVSDGDPNLGGGKPEIMEYAKQHFMHKLDTAYTGRVGGEGEQFLRALAGAVNGSHSVNILTDIRALADRVTHLLGTGNQP